MVHLTFTTQASGSIVRIADVVCSAPRSEFGAEECVESPRLVFPRRGVFECRISNRIVTADSNSALLFDASDTYRVRHPCQDGDDCSVLVYPESIIREAMAGNGVSHSGSRIFPAFLLLLDPETQYQHRLFHHGLRQGRWDSLGLDEMGLSLLSLIGRRIVSTAGRPARRGRDSTHADRRKIVERARELLASRPHERDSLLDIARHVYSSPYHLARVFRSECGTSLHRYRLQLRLSMAIERLAQGENDISRLAMDLGFSSHSHFSADFKRFFGCTPSLARAGVVLRRSVN